MGGCYRLGSKLPGIGGGRQPTECFLRPLLVVLMNPGADHSSGMVEAGEPVLVQPLVAQPSIERFDVGVLVGLARLDQA